MTEVPYVSVIIPHYNDLKGLDICLMSLAAQTYPSERFEVVVGDNASPAGESAVAEVIRGRARLVVVAERGAGPARNGAVAAAHGDVLAFIDSDCVADPNWIAEGVHALALYDLVGGHVAVGVTNPEQITPTEAFECVFAFDFRTYIEKKGFTGAGNMFVPRSLFEAVGGFLPAVAEDKEWSMRAVAAGYRLGYAPRAIVEHPARRTWDELKGKWRRLNAEAFALDATTPIGQIKWFLRTLALPISAVVHTPKVLRHHRLKSYRTKAGALATLYRLRLWRTRHGLSIILRSRRGSEA